jgi:hypothetical protein
LVVSDIKKGKCKLLVLYCYEALNERNDVDKIIGGWLDKYNIPKESIVLSSGNYKYKTSYKYIPYSVFEHEMKKLILPDDEDIFLKTTKRKMKYLCYNRIGRYHRANLVYQLHLNDLLNDGLVSLGTQIDSNVKEKSSNFFKSLPLSFDDTDLDQNQAYKIIRDDFKNSYVSIVTETAYDNNVFFPTEKIYKAIVCYHPFIVVSGKHFLKSMKEFGYKTFSKWFDESYDNEESIDVRIKMIVGEIKKICDMTHEQLTSMIIEMIPVLKHNKKVFLERINSLEFKNRLECEL